jgi:protein TonB
MVTSLSRASNYFNADTVRRADSSQVFTAFDIEPKYPGGIAAFDRFIDQNLKYPEVASLIGISGKVYLTFVIEKDGKVTDVTPVSCLGAGCESEAVRVISMSRAWKPGTQNGKPVSVMYTIPIVFNTFKGVVYLKHLRKSNYGFVFDINSSLYTVQEAEKIIGHAYSPKQIEMVEPFYHAAKEPKFEMPGKKEIYLIKINPDGGKDLTNGPRIIRILKM